MRYHVKAHLTNKPVAPFLSVFYIEVNVVNLHIIVGILLKVAFETTIMFNNPFIRAAGIAAIAYLIFKVLAQALFAFAQVAQSFSYWVKWHFVPWSEEVAIGLGVAFLIFTAVTTSRDRS